MFKVRDKKTKKRFTVYAVEVFDTRTCFLIWDLNRQEWSWVNSENYTAFSL